VESGFRIVLTQDIANTLLIVVLAPIYILIIFSRS
jgi:hypothetical protein